METSLKRTIGLLTQQGLTLSTAESCTGGLVGAAFTTVAGSSDYFVGGVIAYDNRIKTSLLNVSPELLLKYGAVSSETVMAMAQGVQHLFGTECALSTSGIAGPGGGSVEKPVGLVYIGVAYKEAVRSFECHFDGDRNHIREEAVCTAIERLLETIS